MKRLATCCLLALVLAIPVQAQEGGPKPFSGDLLKATPADAWGVLALRDISQFEQKVMTLGQQMNVQIPPFVMMAKGMTGMMSGVANDGPVALVFMPSPQVMMDPGNSMVIYIPVTDFDAMVTAQNAQPVDGQPGVYRMMLMQQNEVYVGNHKDFAVIGPVPNMIAKIVGNESGKSIDQSWNDHLHKIYKKDDLALWINFTGLWADPNISQTIDGFMGMAAMMQGGNTEMMEESLKQLKSLQDGMLGVRLDAEGIYMDIYSSVDPASESAEMLATLPLTEKPLLVGLPAEGADVLAALGLVSSDRYSQEMADQLPQMIKGMLSSPQAQQAVNQEKVDEFAKLIQRIVKGSDGGAFALYGMPAGPDGMVALAEVAKFEGDAATRAKDVGEVIRMLKDDFFTVPGDQKGDFDEVMTRLQFVEDAETIEGASVHHLKFDLKDLPDADESDLETVYKIIGQEGILVRIAAVDDQHMVVSVGGGKEFFGKAVATTKSGKSPLDSLDGIKTARGKVADSRFFEAFAMVDAIWNQVRVVAKEVGEEQIPSLGSTGAAVALTGTTIGKNGSQYDVFIPVETVVAIKDAIANFSAGQGQMNNQVAPTEPTAPGEEQ